MARYDLTNGTILGDAITIAMRNASGVMQCAACLETFGPAAANAARFELEDRWNDASIQSQLDRAKAHYIRRHVPADQRPPGYEDA